MRSTRASNNARRHHPADRVLPIALAAVLSCYLTIPNAAAAIISWTGNAPVYQAIYFNGVTTEHDEFQFLLDWEGFCNAHPTANCAAPTFWGSLGNWAGAVLPGINDEARIAAGSVVVLGSYQSVYQGFIVGGAQVAYVNAGDATIKLGGNLRTDHADIGKLELSALGVLNNNGLVNVGDLTEADGQLTGTGTTNVTAVSATALRMMITGGHTLSLGPSEYSGAISDLWLYDQSTLRNTGTLKATLVADEISGGGTFNPTNQSLFVNTGTLDGLFTMNGVRFNNDGIVKVDKGTFSAMFNGTHTGSFIALADSHLRFGSFGGLGVGGHQFLPSSSITSAGEVVFLGCCHSVEGSYQAALTTVGDATRFGQVTFKGSTALDKVVVNAQSTATFATPQGVSFNDLKVTGSFATAFINTGAASRAKTVSLTNGGTLAANAGLTISGLFTWDAGDLYGSVDAKGGMVWGPGTRVLAGALRNTGGTVWSGGNFSGWTGVLTNPVGSTVDLQGDFGVSSGGGLFDNAGTLIKSAGAGTATLAVALNNSGTVDVQSGTLALTGGGTQTGTFNAGAGSLIQLAGANVIAGPFTISGRLDFVGGSLELKPSIKFTNAVGNSIQVGNLLIGDSATLINRGSAEASGLVTVPKTGVLENHSDFSIQVLDNSGAITSNGIGGMFIADGTNKGSISSTGPLVLRGNFENTGSISTIGSEFANQGTLQNNGSIATSGPGSNFSNQGVLKVGSNGGSGGNVASGRIESKTLENVDALTVENGVIVNSGSFANKGAQAQLTVVKGASITNTGTLTNDGQMTVGGTFTNTGDVINAGNLTITMGGKLEEKGNYNYTQSAGITDVAGVLDFGGHDIYINSGILKGKGGVIGNLWLYGVLQPGNSPGTLTVTGDATIIGDFSLPAHQVEIEIANATSYDQLHVSGVATFNQASVNLMFLPGYTPVDGDSFKWLRAGSVVDGGMQFQVSGLPTGWSGAAATLGDTMRVDVFYEPANDATTQIASSGAVSIAAATVGSNWLPPSLVHPTFLDSLDNAGTFLNHPDAAISMLSLINRTDAAISNRGQMTILNSVSNAGALRNRVGADFVAWADFENSGTLANSGTMSIGGGLGVQNSGTLLNQGTMIVSGIANAKGAHVDNQGVMTMQGVDVVNHGDFVVSGTLHNDSAVITNDGGRFEIARGGLLTGGGLYQQYNPNGDSREPGVTQVDGTLQAGQIKFYEGTLSGIGTLHGPVSLESTHVRPGNPTGTLTIDGDLTLSGADFKFDLTSATLPNSLHVTGKTTFVGVDVEFFLTGDYRPQIGDSFVWLKSDGGIIDPSNSGFALWVVTNDGTQNWYTQWQPTTGERVDFRDGMLTIMAVPEPESWAMLLAGLGVLWISGRRRRARAPQGVWH